MQDDRADPSQSLGNRPGFNRPQLEEPGAPTKQSEIAAAFRLQIRQNGHRNFAASRLRVNPYVISARPALLPPSPRQASQPARTRGSATPDGPARWQWPRAQPGARQRRSAVERQPGAVAHSPASIAKLEAARNSFQNTLHVLCALCELCGEIVSF